MTGAMFVSVPTPGDPDAGELHALRLSLNSPVISLRNRPMGPAAAAIALYAVGGRPRVAVALRCERAGERVFFVHDTTGGKPRAAARLLDAALAFAEGMGFLFDDDEVDSRGAAGPAQAGVLWREFTGGGAPDAAQGPPRQEPNPPLLLTKFRCRIGDAATPAARAGARVRLLGRI